METVPAHLDWVVREKHWISILRFSFPDIANDTDGGQGLPGRIHTPETIAKITKAHIGRKQSPEEIEKRRALLKGRKLSSEHIAKLVGRKHTTETKQKMRDAREGHNGGTRKGTARTERERQAMRDGWTRRRGRAAIVACHGADIFRKCGLER